MDNDRHSSDSLPCGADGCRFHYWANKPAVPFQAMVKYVFDDMLDRLEPAYLVELQQLHDRLE